MARLVVGAISFALYNAGVSALTTDEWKRRTVYQVVTDRFALAEGDEDHCRKSHEGTENCPYGPYCGGTWKGLTEKLDYIHGMGFDAIWISPILENNDCGYHGYWPINHGRINKRMGSHEDLKKLMKAAKSKGIAVLYDGVFNHLGRVEKFDEYYPLNNSDYFHGGFELVTLDGNESNTECSNFDLTQQPFDFATGHCLTKCAPVQYFREVCWMGELDTEVPDLKQDHPDVAKVIMDSTRHIIEEYGFDAMRIDAAPYMNKTFLQRMKKEILKENWVWAEVLLVETTQFFASYQANPDMSTLSNNTEEDIGNIYRDNVEGKIIDGIANFELFNVLRDTFLLQDEKDPGQIQGSLYDFVTTWQKLNATYPDIGGLVNFLDSHDEIRWHLKSQSWDTYKNGMTLIFFLPGIPIAFYGAEQGFKGDIKDTEVRMPMWSTAPGFNMSSHLYQWTRRLVAARKYMLHSLSDEEIDVVENLVSGEHFISFQRGHTIVVVTKHPTDYLLDIEVRVPTNLPDNHLLCDSLLFESDKSYCVRVGKDGNLDLKLNGRPRLMAPPEGLAVSRNLLLLVRAMIPLWLLPLIVFFVISCTQKRLIHIVKPLTPEEVDGANPSLDNLNDGSSKQVVLVASIEHIIVPTDEGKKVKVVAGGLGKVAGLLCQHHPGPMISVHPCMCDQDYSFASPDEESFVYVQLLGEEKTCQIYRYKRPAIGGGPQITFILVDHPMLRDRKDGIYPAPNSRANVLAFYSLWNQVVAKVIDREQPDIFHCPDYHNAMAVLYIERPLPVVVTLHNAEYQGTVETQQMRSDETGWLAEMFNLSENVIRSECISDGSFNMLLPIVRYCKKYQHGYGICGVSRSYAQEVFQKYSIFWGLPELRGIENCMPESERFHQAEPGEEKYWEQKRLAKENIQKEYDLEVDPEARLFVFLGRWVKQKGMDYITDVTEWMLTEYPKAQLVMIGPVGDSYGSYCRMKMQGLLDSKRFEHRLFVYAGFLSVSKDLKLAADFCLMPSRDEPFGYVDIEFAWYGASIIGSFRGGLAKLPGFYFKVYNKDSPLHCQGCLKKAIAAAMTCDNDRLEEMSREARSTAFPVEEWCQELLRFYRAATSNFVGVPETAGGAKVAPVSDLEKPLLQEANGETEVEVKVHTLGQPARTALKNGTRLGMPTIASVGNDLCAMEAQVQFDEEMQEGPQFLPDDIDNVSVTSLETSQEPGHRSERGGWSRQVTPLLSLSRDASGFNKEPSGFSRVSSGQASHPSENEENEFDVSKEFLRQEPLEDDVTGIVEAKSAIATFTKQEGKNADILLEETLWDLELCQEPDKRSRSLGSHFCGIPAIDWIISFAYVIGPLTSVALMGSASYRSTTVFGHHRWEVQKLIAQGVCTIMWTFLSCKVRAHRLMAIAIFSRVLQAFVQTSSSDGEAMISSTAILCGAVQAGDIVLIYFAFMAQSIGDVSKLAVRTGLTMALQSMTKWLIMPLHEVKEPNKVVQSVLFCIMLLFSAVLPIIVLHAPQCYRNFSLPNFWPQFAGFFRLKVAALMGLSNLFMGFTYAPASIFFVWRSQSPRPDNFNEFCLASAFAALAAPVLLATLTLRTPDASINMVKAFACFSFPAFALQCFPMLEVTHAGSHTTGLMWALDAVSILSVILDVMRVMSFAVVILSTVGSRWRFSAYLCVIQVLTYFSKAISFPIAEAYMSSKLPLATEAAMHPIFLTNELMFVALLFCIPELVCRVIAFLFLDQEMLGTLWTVRHRKMEAMLASRS